MVVASGNWAAVLLFLTGFTVYPLARRLIRAAPARARATAAGATLVTPFVVMAAISLAAFLLARFEGGSSVWSRHLLNKLSLQTAGIDPTGLATGFGWGHFVEHLVANGVLEDVVLVGGFIQGPNWDALVNSHFHSHNFLLEALLSGGIIAAALALAWLMALPLFCRRRHLAATAAFAIALTGLETTWFQFAVSLPFMALAFAGLAAPPRRPPGQTTISRTMAMVLAGSVAIQAIATSIYFSDGLEMRRSLHFDMSVIEPNPQQGEDCSQALRANGRGGVHLAWLFRQFVGSLKNKAAKEEPIAAWEAERLGFYICAAEGALSEGASLQLHTAALNARSTLAYQLAGTGLPERYHRFLASWDTALQAFLEKAPLRTDMTIPFLSWTLETGNETAVLRFSENLLLHDPDDRVGLWFSGIVLLGRPSPGAAEGLARLNLALDNGIEGVMPVDTQLKRDIRAAAE